MNHWRVSKEYCFKYRMAESIRACERSVSGAERAKSAAQIRSHQHCVDLVPLSAFYYSINI